MDGKTRWIDGIRVWTEEDERNLERYVEFVSNNESAIGPLGDAKAGEIQILAEKNKTRDALMAFRERLRKKPNTGFAESVDRTRVGVMYEDQYAILARYAVLFPGRDGKEPVPGTYISWHWKSLFGKNNSVCAMPIASNGSVIFLRTYRHASRSWTLEFPRGGVATAAGILEALAQELREEAGILIGEAIPLGKLEPDSGLLSGLVPVYLVRVSGVVVPEREETEAISGLLPLSPGIAEEFIMSQRYTETLPDGSKRTYRLCGGFENFAWLQAKLRGLV